ncbi:hypothetical protein [Streptomyces sp. BK340]|uniref:hypothetical protein n=1 Tax=Streptomyces sp. BK340 TaxID=2572903 RepID=UPI0011ABBCF5|nr:hypothetical protein [Streptomyces sp. BK340]TVZ76880.1 hypothetical protein FB157_14118 [Streptomyces sp. BK340]
MNRIVVVLLTIALVVVLALLVGAAAGVLARLDGVTYPAAVARACAAFAAVLALAAATAGVLAQVLI